MSRLALIALSALAPVSAHALAATATARPFAAPEVSGAPHPGAVEGLTHVALALGLVLAAIFALAWIVRRTRGMAGRAAAALDVLAEVRLGPKERAVLLKVGNTQLLIGVAPGSVSTLHVLEEPVDTAGAVTPGGTPERPSFRALLARSLGKP